MSEAVEAEIIEPEEASELTVAYSPAVIEANFDALEAHVRRLVADYEGATYDMGKDENVKAAKRDRAYLNGIAKEIDERRKAVSREYTKPLAAFEDRCKAVAGIAKQAADGIKAQLDEAEEERQLRAYAKLREHYEEFAGLLAPVVPYERFHEKQWTNKTFGEVKAFKALEAKVERLAQDWETLKAQFQGEPSYDEAERELFATLDLGAAITAAHKAEEERRRIAELKAAMEPEPVEEPEPEPEAVPEPAECQPAEFPQPLERDARAAARAHARPGAASAARTGTRGHGGRPVDGRGAVRHARADAGRRGGPQGAGRRGHHHARHGGPGLRANERRLLA